MRGGVTWAVCAVVLLGAGCSYSTKRLSAFPSHRTIAVIPFENTGFYRDLELDLTQTVVREIRARTSFAFGTPQTADLLLRGQMTAREWAIGLDVDGRVVQKRLEGWLTFEVVERASGRVLRTTTVSANQEYQQGLRGQDRATTATDGWSQRIADQVVQALESGF